MLAGPVGMVSLDSPPRVDRHAPDPAAIAKPLRLTWLHMRDLGLLRDLRIEVDQLQIKTVESKRTGCTRPHPKWVVKKNTLANTLPMQWDAVTNVQVNNQFITSQIEPHEDFLSCNPIKAKIISTDLRGRPIKLQIQGEQLFWTG